MTRTTSAKAYREETENGNITKKQREVWVWLRLNGPATARKISTSITGAWKRLAELKAKGYVIELRQEHDCLTGKTAIAWAAIDPSFQFPQVAPTKPTRKALEEKITHLEARCIELETIIAGYPALMGLVYDKGYQEGVKDGTTGNIVGLEGI